MTFIFITAMIIPIKSPEHVVRDVEIFCRERENQSFTGLVIASPQTIFNNYDFAEEARDLAILVLQKSRIFKTQLICFLL